MAHCWTLACRIGRETGGSLQRCFKFQLCSSPGLGFDFEPTANLIQTPLHVVQAITVCWRAVLYEPASVVRHGNPDSFALQRQSNAHLGGTGMLEHIVQSFLESHKQIVTLFG